MSKIVCLDQIPPPRKPQNLVVKRLTWDWNDPGESVEKVLQSLGTQVQKGCWFVNPVCCVHSAEATRELFGEIWKRQREWFRVLSRQFRSANWKKLMEVSRDVPQRRMSYTGVLLIQGKVIDPRAQ